jgi:dienelactone hydrolase
VGKKREEIIKGFYSIIHHPPIERNTRDITTIECEKLAYYERRKIEYIVGDGDKISAYLLVPYSISGKASAVVAMHQFQENNLGKREPAGMGGNPELAYGDELAKRGYVVIIPDYIAAGERIYDTPFNAKPFYEKYPDWSIIGKNLEDSRAAVDVLCTLPFADSERIGVIGHSLGGHNALLALAFDDRVVAGVTNCGMTVLSEEEMVMEWVDDYYNFMPDMKKYIVSGEPLPFDFHEIAALVCPKPWLNISSYNDFAYGKQQYLAEAGRMIFEVYDMHLCTEYFSYLMHDENHSFRRHNREFAYAWLDKWLLEG